MSRPELFIKIISQDEDVIKYYTEMSKKTHTDEYKDSGFDLIVTQNVDCNEKLIFLKFGIQCSPQFNSGYYLYPRSSISKTNLRMANSVGIIDQGYRGEIMGAVDVISSETVNISKGQRLFQLCHPSLQPMKITIVDELDETKRGIGGFGSTGI